MNGLLGFLKSAKVEQVPESAKGTGGVKKDRTPEGLAIRLFKNGSVYPSQALVDKFDLEYKKGTPTKVEVKDKVMDDLKAKGAEVDAPKTKTVWAFDNGVGNGFDVIDSRQWHQFKADGSMIFISPVGKDEPKVDLFGLVRRDEVTGEPTESVMTQGTVTNGLRILVPAVKEIFGIELGEEKDGLKDFVDLIVVEKLDDFDITATFSQPISLFPKTVARGLEKGAPDYQRRDGAKVYALIPKDILDTPIPEKNAAVTQAPPKVKASAGELVV
jgi:hypothetical protein